MKNKKKSLGFVLSVFFFSMLFVILTIAIAVFSSFTGQAFERSCRQDCSVALNGLSETLKDFSNSVQSAGNELSKNPDLISAVLEKNNYDMVSALKTDVLTHDLSYAFITDKSGKIIASSTSELDLQDLSNLHHVKQALDNQKSLVNEVLTGKMLCVCYGAPILNDGDLIGCVSAVRSLQSVSDSTVETNFLDQLKAYTGCEFSVFLGDEQINTTTSINKVRQNGQQMESDISRMVLQEKQTYITKQTILGKDFISGYMPILGYDGEAIGALFAGKDITSIQTAQRTVMLLIILLAVALMLGATLVLNKFIKKRVKIPLGQVVSLAKNMEHGQIGLTDQNAVSLTIHSEDEVGQVVTALGHTVNSLQIYIGEITDILDAVSRGDLTTETKREYFGDFVEIKKALNTILQSLNETFYDINSAAKLIDDHSKQIADSAGMLSQGAVEQAGAIEQLSDTIEKISTQIKKTADHAAVASTISKQSSEAVEQGNRDVNKLLAAMNDINESSTQIRKIIKAIQDIAFQTNLLALNAAVESARAGEAGKGFAVVANEVRNLAAKSAQAAKQSSVLIENSIAQVNRGMKAVNSTAASFQKIKDSSEKSTALIGEISKATNDEAEDVSQVTASIAQISEVVQKNSAASEENAAASRELSLQSQRLYALVKRFKLKTHQ